MLPGTKSFQHLYQNAQRISVFFLFISYIKTKFRKMVEHYPNCAIITLNIEVSPNERIMLMLRDMFGVNFQLREDFLCT